MSNLPLEILLGELEIRQLGEFSIYVIRLPTLSPL